MAARVVDLRKGKPAKPARSRPLPFPDTPPKRPAPLRTRRRRARLAALGMAIVAIAGLAYAAHAISYIDALSIGTIRINGAEKIDTATIEAYVDSQLADGSFRYFSRRNMFAYPRKSIEQGIVASFPRVRHARLSREALFSQTLDVTIEERNSYALWCKPASLGLDGQAAGEAECYALDDTGFIFTPAATSSHGDFETHYAFAGGVEGDPIGTRFIPGQFPSLLSLLRVLQQGTGLIPVSVDVLPEQDFTIALEQGFYLKASFGQDPQTAARNLNLVLSGESLRDRRSDIEYIDLRFGNRVYYKMKGEEQTNI